MVSTYQQYLCPDFLNPVNNTSLDSNKSPLALLAQTCNSIGLADSNGQQQPQQQSHGHKRKHSFEGVSQSVTGGINCKEKVMPTHPKDSPPPPLKQQKSTSSSSGKSVSRPSPYQADSTTSSGDVSPAAVATNGVAAGHNTSTAKSTSANAGARSTGNDQASTGFDVSTAADRGQSTTILGVGYTTSKSPVSATNTGDGGGLANQQPSQLLPPTSNHAPLLATGSSLIVGGSNAAAPSSSASLAHFNPFFSCGGGAGFPYPAHPAAASASNFGLGGYPAAAPAVAPYYQTLAAAAAAAGAYPKICLDPYCKTCPAQSLIASSAHHAHQMMAGGAVAGNNHKPPCPPGCAQCALALAMGGTMQPMTDFGAWLGAYSSLLSGTGSSMTNGHGAVLGGSFGGQPSPHLLPFLPPYYSSMLMAMNPLLANHTAAAAPSNASAQQSTQQHQPVCWWDNGDGFCMKRFANIDEFSQHLRSHAQESAQKVNGASSTINANSISSNTNNAIHFNSNGNPSMAPSTSNPLSLSSVGQSLVSPSNGCFTNPTNAYNNAAISAYSNLSRFYPTLGGATPKFGLPLGFLPPPSTFSSDINLPSTSASSLASYNTALLSSMLMHQQQNRLPGSLPYP